MLGCMMERYSIYVYCWLRLGWKLSKLSEFCKIFAHLHTIDSITDFFICLFVYVCAQPCLTPTLCNPRDCSQLGSSVHRIFQARILEWVAIFSSRGSAGLRDWTLISCISCIAGGLFTAQPPRKPYIYFKIPYIIMLSYYNYKYTYTSE